MLDAITKFPTTNISSQILWNPPKRLKKLKLNSHQFIQRRRISLNGCVNLILVSMEFELIFLRRRQVNVISVGKKDVELHQASQRMLIDEIGNPSGFRVASSTRSTILVRRQKNPRFADFYQPEMSAGQVFPLGDGSGISGVHMWSKTRWI